MPVDSLNKQYAKAAKQWKFVRDAAEGQDAIAKKDYLPGFVPEDEERYKKYIERAYYLNVTGRTCEGLLGAIFRKPPVQKLPASLEYLSDDADGAGQGLDQLAKRMCDDLLKVGRYGLLADYPEAPEGVDREQQQRLNLRASILSYPAESIINWKTDKVGGSTVLTLVVLKEVKETPKDEFSSDCEAQYRVLRLVDGVYTQSVYNDRKQLVSNTTPLDSEGNAFSFIPFVFVGAVDNKPEVDRAPLHPLAVVNVAHFRNSADYEENLFMHGQLTLGITSSMSGDEFNAANPNGIKVGARAGYFLGEGGSFVTATVPANTGLREAMKDKEEQMVAIGAKLIIQTAANQTAEAARINASSETSVLMTLVSNGSDAICTAISYAQKFMGGDDECEYEINTDFFDSTLNPQEIMALIQLSDRGDIGQAEVRNLLRKSGIIAPDKTDEQLDDEFLNKPFLLTDETATEA